jgi:hypothetical protein
MKKGAVLYKNDSTSGLLLDEIWAGVRPIKRFSDLVRWAWSK